MTEAYPSGSPKPRRVLPDELTEGFLKLGLGEGDRVVMHASLSRIGLVEGGAAMVLHRLLNVLGKKGTLLMPTFTSVTRHSSTHDSFTKTGCWCEGRESRHLPFIPELQPDKEMGEIAHRLCSWPGSRRSRHPAFSFVAVGNNSDGLVRDYSLADPMQPLKAFLKEDPFILAVGVDLDSIEAIHIAEQRRLPGKFVKERALTMGSTEQLWVEVTATGCSRGFQRLANQMSPMDLQEADIGSAKALLYPMKRLIAIAERLLDENPTIMTCERPECLSCQAVRQ
jgi:aminoglycoside 3-N-acetyltransferase